MQEFFVTVYHIEFPFKRAPLGFEAESVKQFNFPYGMYVLSLFTNRNRA